jgi:hypothetical protein
MVRDFPRLARAGRVFYKGMMMTKKEMLDILQLLSALESWGLVERQTRIPDYIHEALMSSAEILRKNILGEDQ